MQQPHQESRSSGKNNLGKTVNFNKETQEVNFMETQVNPATKNKKGESYGKI